MKTTFRLAATAILFPLAGVSAAQDNEMSFFLTSKAPAETGCSTVSPLTIGLSM